MALNTSAVGSYPKPDYLVQARNAYARGKISCQELGELEKKATAFWIRIQEEVGLDVLVHGEMERGDMVAYFAELMPQSMKIGGLVRSYGNRYYHKPIIVDKLRWPGPMTVEMWQYAQSLTNRPVKGMLTGPYTMVEWSFDEYYPSRREAVMDMARVLREEVKALVAAGCRYIQIDEPAIHTRPEEDFDLAVEAFQLVVKDIDAIFHTHICYGEVEKIYPQMLRLPVRQIHLALKNTDFEYLKLLQQHPWDPEKELGAGVVDVHVRRVEEPEEVAQGIRQVLQYVPPERVWVLPDCGLKTRTVEEAQAKLKAMVDGVRLVKRELRLL
jgi:5-methyltetrahydropteroyltriglutamate--homocysteine methyltransferase